MPEPPAAMRERLLGKITLDVEVCEVNHRRSVMLETADVRELLRQAAQPSSEKIEAVAQALTRFTGEEWLEEVRGLLREELGGGDETRK